MKVDQLSGRDLDYWVMRADGAVPAPRSAHWQCSGTKALEVSDGSGETDIFCVSCQLPCYSEHWDTNGLRLIEKYRIHLMPHRGPPDDAEMLSNWWYSEAVDYPIYDDADGRVIGLPKSHGPTALLAGLRCIVAIRFGESVPDET